MTGEPVNLEDKNSAFQKYLTDLIRAEIIQEIGRLRAHRRPNVELTFYFCADYDLVSSYELPGVKLEVLMPAISAPKLVAEISRQDTL